MMAGRYFSQFRCRALVAFIAVFAASPVLAQVAYQVVGPANAAFTPLTGGTVIAAAGTSETVTLPFPFSFYGKQQSSAVVSLHGYLSFTGSGTVAANLGIPYNSIGYPPDMIAVWWDSYVRATTTVLRTQTQGTEPSRRFVIEWKDVAVGNSGGPKLTFQVILYESTHQIRLAYAPFTQPALPSGSASVGLQQSMGQGLVLLPACTTQTAGTCSTQNFPATSNQGQAIDVFSPPDLAISSVRSEDVGYAGVIFRVGAVVKNTGGRAALMAKVRYYLSSDVTWDAADDLIAETAAVDVAALGETVASATGALPSGKAQGNYFVIARVDPDNAIAELEEGNNTSPPVPIKIGPPTPDLFVDGLNVGVTNATPGQSLPVDRAIFNIGNAAAPAGFKYTYFLSTNEVVSPSDIPLGGAREISSPVTTGAPSTASEMVMLPGSCDSDPKPNPCVSAGRYWIGICVDYDPAATPTGTLVEISEVNNCAAQGTGILISTGRLAVISKSLQDVPQFSPTGLVLEAVGGNGTYAWSLKGGQLPPGFSLKPSGELVGTASAAGSFNFEVKVVSGQEEQTQSFTIKVVPANLPLAIVDQQMPAAEFGIPYTASLVAVGGKPPYVWKLKKESRLPAGLALSADGRLEGRATESKELPFGVELTDASGAKAAKELTISVLQPTSFQIGTPGLAAATLGLEYVQPLQSLGGRGPYLWTVVSFQPLAEGIAGMPGPITRDTLPVDFGLKLDKSGESWSLRGVPAKAGLFSVTLKCQDSGTGSEDFSTFPLRVHSDRALAITTTALPDAFVGQPYVSGLTHNGGNQLKVSFSSPCVPQVDPTLMKWGCAPAEPLQSLPPGITLSEKGEIRGTPSAPPELGSNSSLTYSFLVKVEDEAGRQDIRSLSIKLRPDFSQQKSGCSSTGFAPALFSLLALLGLGVRRSKGVNR